MLTGDTERDCIGSWGSGGPMPSEASGEGVTAGELGGGSVAASMTRIKAANICCVRRACSWRAISSCAVLLDPLDGGVLVEPV